MVKEIIQKNKTYGQKYCDELCDYQYISKYAVAHNLSLIDAWFDTEFDQKGNCSHLAMGYAMITILVNISVYHG